MFFFEAAVAACISARAFTNARYGDDLAAQRGHLCVCVLNVRNVQIRHNEARRTVMQQRNRPVQDNYGSNPPFQVAIRTSAQVGVTTPSPSRSADWRNSSKARLPSQ